MIQLTLHRCHFSTALILLGLLLTPIGATRAEAQGRNQFLEEGKSLISKDKPGEAVDELQRALEFPELPLPQRIAILGYLGAAHHLAGNEAEAADAWEERVRLDPDGDLPDDLPGQVRSAYIQARAGVVVVEHLPPPGALAGRKVEIRVNLRDRYAATQELIVYHRRAGKEDYAATPLERDDLGWRTKLTMPALAGLASAYEYEYYVVALSPEGEMLHSAGTQDEPLAVRVMAPTDDPGPLTAILPDPVADPDITGETGRDDGGEGKTGTGIVIVRRDPDPADPAIDVEPVDLVGDAVAIRPGATGRDRQDEIIEAVEIDVDPPDGSRPHRRPGLRPAKTGSAKWVWITIGAIAVVAGGSVAIVAGTSGDKIPQTSLGVIRYP